MPSVLWRCWLGGRKGIRPVKTEWWGAGIIIWLERGANLHSGCHYHSLSLASVKSRLVLPFWYRLTWVVPDKGPLNGCSSVVVPYGTLSQAADLENFATTLQVDCIVNKTRHLHQRSSLLATPLRQSTSLGCYWNLSWICCTTCFYSWQDFYWHRTSCSPFALACIIHLPVPFLCLILASSLLLETQTGVARNCCFGSLKQTRIYQHNWSTKPLQSGGSSASELSRQICDSHTGHFLWPGAWNPWTPSADQVGLGTNGDQMRK